MEQPSVEQVLNIDNHNSDEERRFPVSLVSVAMIIFAPAAFGLMWYDATYHRYFRAWLIIIGLTSLAEGALGFLTIWGESSSSLFRQLGVANSGWSNFLNFILFFLGIALLVLFFYFKKEDKRLVGWSALTLIVASLIALAAVSVTIFSAFSPIATLEKSNLQGF